MGYPNITFEIKFTQKKSQNRIVKIVYKENGHNK